MKNINTILISSSVILFVGCASNPDVNSTNQEKFTVRHPLYVKFDENKKQFDTNLYANIKSLGFRLDNLQLVNAPKVYKEEYDVFFSKSTYKCDQHFFGKEETTHLGEAVLVNVIEGAISFGIYPILSGFPHANKCVFDKDKFKEYQLTWLNKYNIDRKNILNLYNKQFDSLYEVKNLDQQIADLLNVSYTPTNYNIISKETPCSIFSNSPNYCKKTISNGITQINKLKQKKLNLLKTLKTHKDIDTLITLYNKETNVNLKNALKQAIINKLNTLSIPTLNALEKKYKNSIFINDIRKNKISKTISTKNINKIIAIYKEYSHDKSLINYANKRLSNMINKNSFSVSELKKLKINLPVKISALDNKLFNYYKKQLVYNNQLDSVCSTSSWDWFGNIDKLDRPIGKIRLECKKTLSNAFFVGYNLHLKIENSKVNNNFILSGGKVKAYLDKCTFFGCHKVTNVYTKYLSSNTNIADALIDVANKAIRQYNSNVSISRQKDSRCNPMLQKCLNACNYKSTKGFFDDKSKCQSYCYTANTECKNGNTKKALFWKCSATCLGADKYNGGIFGTSDYDKCVDRCQQQ